MSKYKFTPAMREISGFGVMGPKGEAYEAACRRMVVAGLEWFDAQPDAEAKFSELRGVVGVIFSKNAGAKALQDVMAQAAPEPSGAMMHWAVVHVLKAREVGWIEYVRLMSDPEPPEAA